MNAATETVKRHKLTQEDCDIARFFTRRGMKIKEIAKILKVDPSTVGKIQKADFRLETYLEQRKEMNRKTKENKRAALQKRAETLLKDCGGKIENLPGAPGEEEQAESHYMSAEMYRAFKQMKKDLEDMQQPEVPGQMKMDLDQQADNPEEDMRNYMLMKYDDSKQMKFQAAMVDKLVKVLTEMIVTLDNRLTALDEIRDVLKGGERFD